MKASELRQKSEAELAKLFQENLVKLAELKFDLEGGKVKNIKQIRSIKLDLARILTLRREAQSNIKIKAANDK